METLTIGINEKRIKDKILRLIDEFKNDGVEVIDEQSLEDLKSIKATQNEKSISFEEYLKNENRD